MSTRRFAIVVSCVAGTPLLAALVIVATPSVGWAIAVCLGIALAGVVGTIIGAREILQWGKERSS